MSDSNPALWLRNIRQRSASGAWLNIGPLVRPGDNRFFTRKRTVLLPEGVDYAIAQLHNVTSSITCIVVGFVFADHVARQYDVTLRSPRITFAEKQGRGYQFHTPGFQKRHSIRKTRKELRERCADWFRRNLPGLFASGLLEGQFPICEFISLHEQTPFSPPQTGHRPPEYLGLLGIDSDIDAWVSDDLPGFRLGRPTFIDQDEEFHLILAAKHSDIPSDAGLEGYGGRNREGYVNYLNRRVDGLLTRWAVRAMLEGYERVVNSIRDAIPPGATSTSEALKFLGFLRKILNASTDLVAVSSDLVDYSQCRRRFEYDVADFRQANPGFARDESTLAESLRRMISERTAWLRRTDDGVRHLLSQYGTVQSTLVNLRLQRHVKGLTWVILLLTLATLAIGVVGLLRGP